MLSYKALLRGLLVDAPVCTSCGSRNIRPSRRRPDLVTRMMRLRLFRCEKCGVRFALRRREE